MEFDPSQLGVSYMVGLWSLICMCFIILLHSQYINFKKKRWHFVQALTEISSFASIFGGIAVVIAAHAPNPVKTAICWDFYFNGVSVMAIQLCDNYMFYNRFKAITKISSWKDKSIQMYIWLVMTFSWVPAYTLGPYFVNTNVQPVADLIDLGLLIQGWGAIAFSIYFTYEFTLYLIRGTARTSRVSRRNKKIAGKSILHCVSSCTGNYLASSNEMVLGVLIYIILIPPTLHFLFNFRIEKFCECKQKLPQSSRGAIAPSGATQEQQKDHPTTFHEKFNAKWETVQVKQTT